MMTHYLLTDGRIQPYLQKKGNSYKKKEGKTDQLPCPEQFVTSLLHFTQAFLRMHGQPWEMVMARIQSVNPLFESGELALASPAEASPNSALNDRPFPMCSC